MKRFVIFLFGMLPIVAAYATTETVHYYIGDEEYSTTCESGGDLVLPTPPSKQGYTFVGYESLIEPVEYLANSTDEGINTGVQGNHNIKYRIKFNTLNLGGSGYNVVSGGLFRVVLWGENLRFDYNNQFIGYCNINSGSTYDFLVGDTYIKNNETDVFCLGSERNNDIATSSNLMLGSGYGRIQIILLQIWENDVLIRDFVPVKNKNGTPAMYEKIEGKFYYGNNWIAGPAINE